MLYISETVGLEVLGPRPKLYFSHGVLWLSESNDEDSCVSEIKPFQVMITFEPSQRTKKFRFLICI